MKMYLRSYFSAVALLAALGSPCVFAESAGLDYVDAGQMLLDLTTKPKIDAWSGASESLIASSKELTARVQALRQLGVNTPMLGEMDVRANDLAKQGIKFSEYSKKLSSSVNALGNVVSAAKVVSNVVDDVQLYGTGTSELYTTSLIGGVDVVNAFFSKAWPLSSLGLAAFSVDKLGNDSSVLKQISLIVLNGASDPIGALADDARALRELMKSLGDTDALAMEAADNIVVAADKTIARGGWGGANSRQAIVMSTSVQQFNLNVDSSIAAQRQYARAQVKSIDDYIVTLTNDKGELMPFFLPGNAARRTIYESLVGRLKTIRAKLNKFDSYLANPENRKEIIKPMTDAWLIASYGQMERPALEARRYISKLNELAKKVSTMPALGGKLLTSTNFSIKVGETISVSGSSTGVEPVAVTIVYFNSSDGTLRRENATRNNKDGTWVYGKAFTKEGSFYYRIEVSDGLKGLVEIGRGKVDVKPAYIVASVASLNLSSPEIKVGDAVTLTVKTTAPVKSVRVVFDQLPGGPAAGLVNPAGNGTDWELRGQKVTVPGPTANQFQRPIWAIATKADGNDTAAFGPAKLTVRPQDADGMRLADETYKDDTVVPAKGAFAKTWTLENTGTTTWNSGYCLKPVSGAALGSGQVCVNGLVAPGARYVFSVPMVAPTATINDQSVQQVWRLGNATGIKIGSDVWAKVLVKAFAHVQGTLNIPTALRATTEPLQFSVNLSAPATSVVFYLANPDKSRTSLPLSQVSPLQWTLPARPITVAGNRVWQLEVTSPSGIDNTRTGTLDVLAQVGVVKPVPTPAPVPVKPVPTPVPVVPPVTPVVQPLTPVLTKTDNAVTGTPWAARLTTNIPVYSASMVFKSGRIIPFDVGPFSWETRDNNTVFKEAGSFDYELQIRRLINSAVEVFPGGRLEVHAAVPPAIVPVISSASSVEQGKPYILAVRTSTPADRVSVKWSDETSELALRAVDSAHTQWEGAARVFMQSASVPYSVQTYKEGFVAPTGQIAASLGVTVAGSSMRLLEISRNVQVGESPYFTVATSLSVARVSVKLGNDIPVNLLNTGGSGAEQNFRAMVPARSAGNVPYTITAFNSRGTSVATPIVGVLQVAAVTDALKAPNPIPPSIESGQYVDWHFVTNKNTNQMYLEFAAPIGTIPLSGAYLKAALNYPTGTYAYRLMRRDDLGNVYPIDGASGSLTIKPKIASQPAVGRIVINGQVVQPGGRVVIQLNAPLSIQVVAPGAKGVIFRTAVVPLGDMYFDFWSNDGNNWQSKPLPNPTLKDFFRGLARAGDAPAQIYLSTGGNYVNVNPVATVNFTVTFQ